MFKNMTYITRRVSYKILVTDQKERELLHDAVYNMLLQGTMQNNKRCIIKWTLMDKYCACPTLELKIPREYDISLNKIIHSNGYRLIMVSKNTLILKHADLEEGG